MPSVIVHKAIDAEDEIVKLRIKLDKISTDLDKLQLTVSKILNFLQQNLTIKIVSEITDVD